MHRVGSLLAFIGGGIGRVALSGVLIGFFFVIAGVTPWQFFADNFSSPPSLWLSPIVTLVGLAVIWGSLQFNRWSRHQKAIDALAEDLGWAIRNLLNRNPRPSTPEEVQQLDTDFQAWCAKINSQLENRAFFTTADQLHFDRLGFVPMFSMGGHPMAGHPRYDKILSMLNLKFERLRDIINWSQQRRR